MMVFIVMVLYIANVMFMMVFDNFCIASIVKSSWDLRPPNGLPNTRRFAFSTCGPDRWLFKRFHVNGVFEMPIFYLLQDDSIYIYPLVIQRSYSKSSFLIGKSSFLSSISMGHGFFIATSNNKRVCIYIYILYIDTSTYIFI